MYLRTEHYDFLFAPSQYAPNATIVLSVRWLFCVSGGPTDENELQIRFTEALSLLFSYKYCLGSIQCGN